MEEADSTFQMLKDNTQYTHIHTTNFPACKNMSPLTEVSSELSILISFILIIIIIILIIILFCPAIGVPWFHWLLQLWCRRHSTKKKKKACLQEGRTSLSILHHAAPSSRLNKANHISGTLKVVSQHLHRKKRVCFPWLSAANVTQKHQWACSRRRTNICASICLQTTTTVESMWVLVDSSGFDLLASFWSKVIDFFFSQKNLCDIFLHISAFSNSTVDLCCMESMAGLTKQQMQQPV